MNGFFDRVAQRSFSRAGSGRLKRRLSYAVAVELAIAGLAVPAISRVTPPSGGASGTSTSFESTTAAVAGDGRAASRPGGAVGGSEQHLGNRSGSRASEADEVAQAAPNHRAAATGRGISFKAPVDFATGAVPSSAAFNLAHGDQMPLPYSRATPMSDGVAVGDFDHDGNLDVAQTNVIAGTVSIFLGDGRGGFAPPQQHPVGVNPVFVVSGDLDLDGHLDLAVANYASNNVSILRGDGKGGFLLADPIAVPAPRNVAIGEFNGDGVRDLAVASSGRAQGPNASPVGGVAILTGTEGGTFAPAQVIEAKLNGRPVGANYVAVGDFDGRGFDDLAVGVGTSTSAGDQQAGDTKPTGDDALIYINRNHPKDDGPLGASPQQPFITPEQQRIRVGGLPNAISVADLNGDTHLDLAVLACSGHITTLLGDGQGQFVSKATNATVGALPFALATADFNDDGLLDLVTANWTSSTVSVLAGNGDGIFQPAVDFWSGDATTSAAVGDFNEDGRVDIVAARLRDDHLALLLNDSPQRGDGVVVHRDIPYGSPTHPTNDRLAAHHTLDVYTPPRDTPSFSGPGRPYPVVFFVHGGGGMTGDKSMVSYVMRSLALEGLVAVATDYRLGLPGDPDQVKDVAQAFRWTRDNVASVDYCGDPNNIFVSGTSNGALLASGLATDEAYVTEQKHIRGLITLGAGLFHPGTAAIHPPSLLMTGDEGIENALTPGNFAYSAVSRGRGADSRHVIVPGRDHMTIVSDVALPDDLGRFEIIKFLRAHLVANP